MDFLNHALDSFLWPDSFESSDSDSAIDIDIEIPAGARRILQKNGVDQISQHGEPSEMILYSNTFDSIEEVDDLSTELDSSDSSYNDGAVGSWQSAPTSDYHGKTKDTRETKNIDLFHEDTHVMWIPHGKFWTFAGIALAWTAFVCAYQARNTPRFVTVESPIYVDATFEEAYDVGMIKLQLCLNMTSTGMAECSIHDLDTSTVSDRMFQIARSMAFLAIILGGFLATLITSAMFWSTINLVPIGVGFLAAYFFQSLTFLLFESELCSVHKCHVARGSIYSIIGCLCWILAAVASARMDAFKYRRTRANQIAKKKSHNGSLKPSILNRGASDITQQTDISTVLPLPRSPDRRIYQKRVITPDKGQFVSERSTSKHNSRSNENGHFLCLQGTKIRKPRIAGSPLRSDRKSAEVRENPTRQYSEKVRHIGVVDDLEDPRSSTSWKQLKEHDDRPNSKRQRIDPRTFEM
jgi:hypothetical protein